MQLMTWVSDYNSPLISYDKNSEGCKKRGDYITVRGGISLQLEDKDQPLLTILILRIL